MTEHNASDSDNKTLLREIFEQQKDGFLSNPYPTKKERKEMLVALKRSLIKNKDRFIKSLSADYSHRSADDTLLIDFMPSILAINFALKNISNWMKPEKRHVSILYQPASARIEYQPLGVVGIIVPWNYPIYLTIGPLVAALAAGNRVMIKLSEFTPYTNRIIKEALETVFDATEVTIVEGDAKVAAEFSSLPFDHLLFTGSTAVGKHVMRAASENLTPVTLELGGKSPVIVADDIPLETAVERIVYGKCANAGQTCIAPDYVLCPEDKLARMIELLENQFQTHYPSVKDNPDYSAIIDLRQHKRLQDWIEQAKSAGCDIIQLNPSNEEFGADTRKIPLTLVINPPEELDLSQQEIFGPILPIFSYQKLDDAIKHVQDRPRPLALYLMSYNKKVQQRVLKETHAGGVCINDSLTHAGQDDLPFGGVGSSGMGQYHAKEGFLTFSKAKAVFKKGRINSTKLAMPPYGKLIHKLLYWFYLR